MRAGLAALVLSLAPAAAGPALAQAYQCTLPRRVEPGRPVRPDGPVRRAAIAGYTLAASWSPEYCRRPRDRATMQCSGANGRFGFVLHGLWPEAAKGPAPQWCPTTRRPSPELIRSNLCMTPVPWLIEHEWAKHGSCMARRPETYLRVSAILWRSLQWPDLDRLSRRGDLTAGELRRAFVMANPGWTTSQVTVLASRGGWLRELHLCYGRDFRPRDCPRGKRGPADQAPIRVWRGLE